jgi:hypothetical protein
MDVIQGLAYFLFVVAVIGFFAWVAYLAISK